MGISMLPPAQVRPVGIPGVFFPLDTCGRILHRRGMTLKVRSAMVVVVVVVVVVVAVAVIIIRVVEVVEVVVVVVLVLVVCCTICSV